MLSMVKIFPKLLLILALVSMVMLSLEKTNFQQSQKLEKHIKNVSDNLTLSEDDNEVPKLNGARLKKIAQSVTVKIFADDENDSRGGSGVIISSRNNDYFVITNNHVVSDLNTQYKLQTYEGKIYPTEVIEQNNLDLNVDDLALLKFTTHNKYEIVTIKLNISIDEDKMVFASGFPFEDNLKQSPNIEYTLGYLTQILPLPLMGGYQIGYTNNVHNGMSGGSIINRDGQLIGINGLGKEPLFGNPYVFQNGQDVPQSKFEQMSQLSWGITSDSIVNFVDKIQVNEDLHFQLNIVD